MKTIANRLVISAVSAIVLGTVAWGQSTVTTTMWAKIPFAFHTSKGTLPAGEYRVIDGYNGIQGILALQSSATNKWVITMGAPADSRDTGTTAVVFRCDGGCELVGLKTRNHSVLYPGSQTARGREIAVIATYRPPASAE
jgi:hypothetical protein